MLSQAMKSLFVRTPIGLIPVRVLHGPAKGARWTLGPFSANWRRGGAEEDVAAGARYLGDLNGKVFWDFGAHFGIHTVGKAMQVGPTGQVVNFEPDPVAFARLKRHVNMNGLENVILFEAAASAQDGEDRLFMTKGGGEAISHIAMHAGHEPSDVKSQIIRTMRADTLVEAGRIRAPDLIKIDVQGHGHRAVEGALNTISAHKPVIVFSNHSWEELAGVQKALEPLGYEPKDLDGKQISWADITECVLVAN